MPPLEPISDIQAVIEDLIRTAQALKALEYLQGKLPNNSDKRQQLIMLQGQYIAAEQENGLDLLANNDWRMIVVKVNQSILKLSGSLTNADFEAQTAAIVKTPVADKPKFVIIYTKEDEEHSKMLNKHLTVLVKITKKISVYNVYEAAGDQLVERAEEEMKNADYLLVLVTVNLFASEWFDLVLKALGDGKRIIPIIITNTVYQGTGLEKFLTLPKGMPVEDFASKDKAYSSIAEELAKLVPK